MKGMYVMFKTIDINMSVVEIADNLTVEDFPLAIQILNKRHKFSMTALSSLTGIPRKTLYKFIERGYAYKNEAKTEKAIQQLKKLIVG